MRLASPILLSGFVLLAASRLTADRFDDAYAKAQANLATPEGTAYAERLAARFDEKTLREALTRCAEGLPPEDAPPFVMLMELTADGRPSQILLRPPAPVAVCLRWVVRDETLPRPPAAGYWVSVDLDSRRVPGAPIIPTPGVATATVPPTRTPAAPSRPAPPAPIASSPKPSPTQPPAPAPTVPAAPAASEDVIDFGADGTPIHVPNAKPDLGGLRRQLKESRATVLGPILAQSEGVPVDDPRLEAYWSLAEELGLPAVVPLGVEWPGSDQTGDRYRVALGDPLKLEAVLVRHPRLTLVVAGAAWPLGDALTAIMWKYPRVYADTGVIAWWLPRREFHAYLRRLMDANLGGQILFASGGSTVERVAKATEAVRSADFLTPEQKEAILRGNAAKLLGAPKP